MDEDDIYREVDNWLNCPERPLELLFNDIHLYLQRCNGGFFVFSRVITLHEVNNDTLKLPIMITPFALEKFGLTAAAPGLNPSSQTLYLIQRIDQDKTDELFSQLDDISQQTEIWQAVIKTILPATVYSAS
ncbi:hypothetical protein OLZ33_00565 [Pantoea ananatis]|uniref:hypothetical protein n=1 Tax=Pantoea ananas TaxID=553 RepID=UPI00158D9F7C|nr:hypothetical protein [Pantoea ananatis]MBA4820163.1 hypothetical protein [Pantoea ananatis]MCW1830493.1 hypothetical protein [Pantoea ananatis]QKV90093.1 hypothetical protein FOB88_24655 [Pantoea ananatis]